MSESNQQSVLFPGAFSKKVVVKFDAAGQSSDGGVVLLKSLDEGLGLTSKLLEHLTDGRDQRKVTHSHGDLFRQRVLGIALGYSDCNDSERTRSDPCLKMACDRPPLDPDADLGSQPTLSRFENAQSGRELVGMQRELESHVIKRLAKRRRGARLVTLDLDPSCDATHGQQQHALFHGKYGTWCYLPQFGFLTIDDEPEQFLFHTRLRPGNARCYRGVVALLRRVVPQIRKCFKKARVRVRLDSGFSNPALFDELERLKVEYVVGMGGNKVLNRYAESAMEDARAAVQKSGETETVFTEAKYKARSWSGERRAIIKAEVVCHPGRDPKDNARFVITNLRQVPQNVYAIYRARGDAENRIKELQDLESDRTSCSRFLANQLRLLMTATAFVLYQELRWRLRRTSAARSQVGRLQLMLMKLGARVVESVRRVVMHFPTAHPWQELWVKAAIASGARLT